MSEQLNPDVKAKWVKALRSRKFKQGRMALRNGARFCCLGVLCEVAVAEGVIPAPTRAPSGEWVYDGENLSLPASVQDWAFRPGYSSSNPYIDSTGFSLAELNDGEPDTFGFRKIADLIEVNL